MTVLRPLIAVMALSCLMAVPGLSEDSVYQAGSMTVPRPGALPASDRIDQLVLARLNELNLVPAQLSSDAVFLRRAYITTIGTLPTEEEARAFLDSPSPGKRAVLIDMLLERPEFVTYWTMKWSELLRVKAEFPIKLWPNAVQAYHRWIQESVAANKPYSQFVQELLTGNGSNFREGEVNFYRATQDRSPQGIASTVALTFLGERADKWPKKKLDAMAGFFANVSFKPTGEWKEEIVYYDALADEKGLSKGAILPDGTPVRVDPSQHDPRVLFATWLLRPDNPYLSRNMVNRAWSWLMGRGIVHEPDDIRPDNPPSNPALLEFLMDEFTTHGTDMKHLFRVILNSQTFQLSSIPAQDTPEAAANFAHYPLRRLGAEVLIDALNQLTETTEEYSSPIPEPFTWVPTDIRGIAIADGSITSSFLELFGRPPRDTGLESERGTNTTTQQRLHLINSSHVQNKIKVCPLVTDTAGLSTRELIERLYLAVLSRFPTEKEIQTLDEYGGSGRALASDLTWALINQPEFYFNH